MFSVNYSCITSLKTETPADAKMQKIGQFVGCCAKEANHRQLTENNLAKYLEKRITNS